MFNTMLQGAIVAWFYGIPLVIIIIATNRDSRTDLILINVNKLNSPETMRKQALFLLKLIHMHSFNKNAAILLDGYIETHRGTCNEEDCPLKQKLKTTRITKSLIDADDNMNEKYALLI